MQYTKPDPLTLVRVLKGYSGLTPGYSWLKGTLVPLAARGGIEGLVVRLKVFARCLCRAKTNAVPRLFSVVHGGIRGLDERVRVTGVRRIDRDADAGPDVDALLPGAELERCSKGGNDFPGDHYRLLAPGVGQDQSEFIPPDAGDRVRFPYLATDPGGNGFQELVAGVVSQGVVHRLELVQVEIQQRELAGVAFGEADRLLQPVVEQQAVRQAGEAVVMRYALDALLRQLMLRNVGGHREPAHHFAFLSHMRQKLDLEIAGFTGLRRVGALVMNRMSLQHLHKIALDFPVHRVAQDVAYVLADKVLDGKAIKLGKCLACKMTTPVLIPVRGHCGNVGGEQAQLVCRFTQGTLRPHALGNVGTDPAGALARARGIEYRISTDRDIAFGTVGTEARELEIAKRLVRIAHRPMRLPTRLIRRQIRDVPDALAKLRAALEHRSDARPAVGRHAFGKPMFPVALPVEVRRHCRKAAKARLAHAQPAPQLVDLASNDGENRQESCKQQPAHPFFLHVIDCLGPQMHQQVDNET